MQIKFLNVTPPEAIQIIIETMNEGYELLDKIRREFMEDKSGAAAKSKIWDQWYIDWMNRTLEKLLRIYAEPSRAYNFREKIVQRMSMTSDNAYTPFEHTFDVKIGILWGYYNFIMTRSSVTITINGNISFQQGENLSNEQK